MDEIKTSTPIASLSAMEYSEISDSTKIPVSTGGNKAKALTIENLSKKVLDLIKSTEYEELTINITCGSDLIYDQSILVYIGESTSPKTYPIDSLEISFTVPVDQKYKVVFPDITGYTKPVSRTFVAALEERTLSVEYTEGAEETIATSENVTVYVRNSTSSYAGTGVSGYTVNTVINGVSGTLTTDSTGKATFSVPQGQSYTVSIAIPTDAVEFLGKSKTYTADSKNRVIYLGYMTVSDDIWLYDDSGNHWSAADITGGTVTSDKYDSLKYMVFRTSALQTAGCVFGFDIDQVVNKTAVSPTYKWSDSYLFTSVPSNGNSASANFYYDGKTATSLIIDEGDKMGIQTYAFDKVVTYSITVGGTTKTGFLGSAGQWQTILNMKNTMNTILKTIRPDTNGFVYLEATNHWSSTQRDNTVACYVSSSLANYTKTTSFVVLPFYDF